MLKEIVETVNSLSPLGIVGLLSYVIYLLVQQKKTTKSQYDVVTSNHLHDLPEMAESLRRIEQHLHNGIAAQLGQLAYIRDTLAKIDTRLIERGPDRRN